MTETQKPELVEITVEQLTVYRYHVEMSDDVTDPEAIALERFRAGELPDAGPAEGEEHELTTYFVGPVKPESAASLIYDEWCEEYRPIANDLCQGAPYDGLMFETYGAEVEHVRRQDRACIWTLVQAEDELIILSGWHFVNRLGYFVTERPWGGLEVAEITLD
ncbi:MAG: hypothetical protein CMO08_05185 [Thalassospira sp.]|nr:hypothetical protein [Thalassospira sp.]|tara:strand:+ start:24363 stop:24851 length:489 start_codon:yes stop_codon:yes gene_type:complete